MSDESVSKAAKSGDADPLIGTILADKYEILSVLGEGGMSVVYKARHKLINKIVAVKLLLPQLVRHETSVKRFQQEAVAASQLNHPNVISVSDFGETEDGRPFLVMEYLEGESVADIIKRTGPLSVERSLDIMIQSCEALKAAHEKNIIHRDLKPSNVMIVSNERGDDLVKVVDFGIAKLMVAEGEDVQKLTQTGELFGSPLYMSPEQCKAEPIDARSDVYSMGCLMYEMLAGRVPLLGGNMIETMYMHMNEMPEGLEGSIKNVQLRRQLERVIFRALAKDPETRYPAMEWMVSDLKEIQQGERQRLLSRIRSIWDLIWLKHLPKKQRPIFRTAIVLGVLFAAVAIGVSSGVKDSLLSPPDLKLPEVAWIERKERTVKNEPGQKRSREEGIAELFANWRFEKSARNPNRSTNTAHKLATHYFNNGDYAEALRLFKQERRLRKDHSVGTEFDMADVWLRIGDCYYLMGNYGAARRHYIRGVQLKADLEDAPRGLARPYFKLGEACLALGRCSEARFYYNKSLRKLRSSMGSKETYEYALAKSRVADTEMMQAGLQFEEKAVRSARATVDRLERRFENLRAGQDEARDGRSRQTSGSQEEVYQSLSRETRELTVLTVALNKAKLKLSRAQTRLDDAKSKKLERAQEAAADYDRAAKIWAHLAGFKVNAGVARFYQGRMNSELDDAKQALKNYKAAVTCFERRLPPDHPYIAVAADEYADLLWRQGQRFESLKRRLQANKIKRELKEKHRAHKTSEDDDRGDGEEVEVQNRYAGHDEREDWDQYAEDQELPARESR